MGKVQCRFMPAGHIMAFLFVAASLLISVTVTYAHTDKGEPELRVCSQNIHNYKLARNSSNKEKFNRQTDYLVERFYNASCNVIAVQELMRGTKKEGEKSLKYLAKKLSAKTNTDYQVIVGESQDKRITNAYLVDLSIAEVLSFHDYSRKNVPQLSLLGPTRIFFRGPLELKLRIKPKTNATSKELVLYNIHFKSKADGWKDPTGTMYEILRMEMAEGLRNIIEAKAKQNEGAIVMVLGDRNSDTGSATDEILSGKRTLNDFRSEDSCSLNGDLVPECKTPPANVVMEGLVAEAISAKKTSGGSYRYKKKLYLLDEIYIHRKDSQIIRNQKGEAMVGIEGVFGKGSDHKLTYAELNW